MNGFSAPALAAGRAILDVLLPPSCACCDMPVAQPGQLCGTCFAKIGFVTEPCCRHCGLPREVQGGPPLCEACQLNPPPWGRARAALIYDEHARKLILPLKHADRTENARVLGFHMARAGAALLAAADWLVPVPLHRRRLLNRRYNQAALLAHDLARRSGVRALPDALRRTKSTVMLAELSSARRAAELADAIMVRANRRAKVQGRRILLIDDVLTSGATAGACTRALLDAGALSIDVLVASRVPAPRD